VSLLPFEFFMNAKPLRSFIAINIPDEIKSEIGEIIHAMMKYGGDIKWVSALNLHITLKFLGTVEETALPEIQNSLRSAVSSYLPFCIKIYGTGVFPNRKYPRVIWTGIEDSVSLKNLKRDIENAMTVHGYQKEDKDFSPHLTLGRVRSQKGIIATLLELDKFKAKDFGVTEVDRVNLMKSDLKPQGPEYSCLFQIPFDTVQATEKIP
jgi:RNA 2',3'-cyclic 3'-phosphodiesterase